MEYKCPKCDAVLIQDGDDYKCEYCKSEYNVDYLNNVKNVNYIIPFEIDKKLAIKKYKQLIKFPSLTPKPFNLNKNIKKIKGVYLPCYIYNLESIGEIEFECNKVNTWKSSGVKYKKSDIYNVIRSGNMSIKNLPIITTNEFDDDILNSLESYDYNKMIKFDTSYTEKYKICKSDKPKKKIQKYIELKYKEFFVSKMIKDIKNYNEIKDINSSINIDKLSKKSVLLPIWFLNVKYKNKNYMYIINGQNGEIFGSIPINKRKIIFIWILLYVFIFIILLLLSLLKVML